MREIGKICGGIPQNRERGLRVVPERIKVALNYPKMGKNGAEMHNFG